jgi:hypothetical protein
MPPPKPPPPKPAAEARGLGLVAEAVVLGALLGVLQDVVGLGRLAELLGRLRVLGVAVGVVLHRQLAVGLLDLGLAGLRSIPSTS